MTAATLVGSNSATAGTVSATSSGTMSLTGLGVATGDLVIVQCAVERNSTTPGLAIAGGVSSFTTLMAVTTGTNVQTIIGYFFAQAGDLTATVAGTAAAARRIVAAVQVWRGASTPTVVSNAAVSNGGGVTTLTHPSATPATADNVIMLAFGGAAFSSNFNTRTFTAAASFNKRIDAGATNTTSIDPYIGFSDQTLSGGAGTPTGTMTATASLGNFEYVAATLLLPPASTAWTADVSSTTTATVTADTTRNTLAAVSSSTTATITADTTRTTLAQLAPTTTATITANTVRTTFGQVSVTTTATVTADVTVTHAGKTGDVTVTTTATIAADTTRAMLGQTSVPVTATVTTDATRQTLTQVTSSTTATVTVTATVTHAGGTLRDITLVATEGRPRFLVMESRPRLTTSESRSRASVTESSTRFKSSESSPRLAVQEIT